MAKQRTKYIENFFSDIDKKLRIRRTYNDFVKFLLSTKYSTVFSSILLFLIAATYIFRAHPYITKPQLYAEDGAVWLSSGYDKGLVTIFKPYNGFSHLFERIFGIISAYVVPLKFEPTLYVVTALVIFLLLCGYLLSNRSGIFSSNYQKLFFALSMCLLGNAEEFYFSFSNSVFLLGLVGVLLIVATKPKRKFVDVLEKILFFVLCFTIVFSWIYFLILAFEFIWQRKRRYFYLITAFVGAVVQYLVYSTHANGRPNIPIRFLVSKATVYEFYNQMILPSLKFARQDISPASGNATNLVFVFAALIIVTAIFIFIYAKSNYKTKCVLFFCALMTIISLKSPVDGQVLPGAIVLAMATYHWGNRYFIFGIISLFIVWAKFSQKLFNKAYLPVFLSVFFLFGLLSSITLGSYFIQKDFVNLTSQYSNGIKEVSHNKNKLVIIPINPENSWFVRLGPNNNYL